MGANYFLTVIAFFGLLAAIWRCCTADRNLEHLQFRSGSKMLDFDNHYSSRVAGAIILATLLRDAPKYDERITRVFEAFLDFPPHYGKNTGREKEIDFTSRETVVLVNALNKRPRKQRNKNCLTFRTGGPFIVRGDGGVEKNPLIPAP